MVIFSALPCIFICSLSFIHACLAEAFIAQLRTILQPCNYSQTLFGVRKLSASQLIKALSIAITVIGCRSIVVTAVHYSPYYFLVGIESSPRLQETGK